MGPPAIRNALSECDFFGCAIAEVHDYAMEVHRTADVTGVNVSSGSERESL